MGSITTAIMGNMCGRYVLFSSQEQIIASVQRETGAREVDDVAARMDGVGPYRANYNIAPTHQVPVVREFRERVALGPAQWGYPRASGSGGAPVVFNARGETAFEKFLFRGSDRCLFVMDGWYEWTGAKGNKQPCYTHRKDNAPFVVAGLCKPIGNQLHATIITTAAAEPLEWLHHRMPRVLGHCEAMAWLDAQDDDAQEMARNSPAEAVIEQLATRKADRAVGGVGNNGPELIQPQPDDEPADEEKEY